VIVDDLNNEKWYLACNWTLNVVSNLIGSMDNIFIQTLLSDVHLTIREPFKKMLILKFEDGVGESFPFNKSSLFAPILKRIKLSLFKFTQI
jgi:hypothetical protein